MSANPMPTADEIFGTRRSFDALDTMGVTDGARADDGDLSQDGESFLRTAPEAPTPVIADLVPGSGIVMPHGQPRSRKSLVVLETLIAASLGVPPFNLARLTVAAPVVTWYVTEEDHAGEVKQRVQALKAGRGLLRLPDNFRLSVQRGLSLDDGPTQDHIIRECVKYGVRVLALDPIRSLSAHVDQGPSELKPLVLYLRRLQREAGVVVIPIHHDTKLRADGTPDDRPRAHRASGGGILSIAEAPIHFERVSDGVSLLVPNLWKFSADPPSIKVNFQNTDGALRLTAEDVAADAVNTLALHEKIVDVLSQRPDLATSKVATAVHGRKEDVTRALEHLAAAGIVDSRQDRNAVRWFIRKVV